MPVETISEKKNKQTNKKSVYAHFNCFIIIILIVLLLTYFAWPKHSVQKFNVKKNLLNYSLQCNATNSNNPVKIFRSEALNPGLFLFHAFLAPNNLILGVSKMLFNPFKYSISHREKMLLISMTLRATSCFNEQKIQFLGAHTRQNVS